MSNSGLNYYADSGYWMRYVNERLAERPNTYMLIDDDLADDDPWESIYARTQHESLNSGDELSFS